MESKKYDQQRKEVDSNGNQLLFEVPCELANVTTHYRYVK